MPETLGPSPQEKGIPEREISPEEERKDFPFEGIMVFGHGYKAKGYRLSPEARMRAIAAYELWKDGVAPRIIFTGGPPTQADREKYGQDLHSNAELMREMLLRRYQVPEGAIMLENQSFKTVDNVAHALNEMEGQGVKVENFVTVSTGYHLERIQKIMKIFNLKSAPVPAEEMLNARAREHAEKMKARDIARGLSSGEVEKNYQMRANRYERLINRLKGRDPVILSELQDEPKWSKAMENWGYWGPLALAVRGEKLKALVDQHQDEVESWLGRHPELEVTMEDIIAGNFDYRELCRAREMPK